MTLLLEDYHYYKKKCMTILQRKAFYKEKWEEERHAREALQQKMEELKRATEALQRNTHQEEVGLKDGKEEILTCICPWCVQVERELQAENWRLRRNLRQERTNAEVSLGVTAKLQQLKDEMKELKGEVTRERTRANKANAEAINLGVTMKKQVGFLI